ncbi:putative multidrug export ATP-binding/permease protein, partial [termite gut metagenome]
MKEFIRILKRFVPPYKKYLILNVLFNFLSAVLNVFSFVLIKPILEILFKLQEVNYDFISWNDSSIDLKDKLINNAYFYITDLIRQYGESTTLLILGLFLIVMTFFKTGCYFLSSACMMPIRTGIVRDIRIQLYAKILSLPLSFFSEKRKGDIIARTSGDVQEVEVSITSSLDMLFKNPILIFIYFATLVIISWQLTLFTIIVLPFMGWIMGVIGRKLKRNSLIAQERWSNLMSQLEE